MDYKKIIYTFIFIASCLLTIIVSNVVAHSLTIPVDNIVISHNENINDQFAYWQEEILKMDAKCTKKYESFFGQKFTDTLVTGEDIVAKLRDIEQQTGKKTAAIWMWSYPDYLDVMMVTATNKPTGTKVSQENKNQLQPMIAELMNEVTNPTPLGIRNSTSYLGSSQKIYQWMIAPLRDQLEAEQIDTLVICVGPSLRTLPFAVLHDGRNFLIEKYSIAMVPSFSLTDLSLSQKYGDGIEVLAMGKTNFEVLSPLPGVSVEIDNITPSPWQGVKMMEEQFTTDNLKAQRKQNPFEIVHLATHAQFEAGEPSNSYIQFADRELTLTQLQELDLKNPPVALLVLSACQTAIGDKQSELGFSGLAVQSGVRSALGSYWYVSDAGTLALMTEFYQHLKSYYDRYNILFKADALRDTQISMIRNRVYLDKGQLRTTRGGLSLPSELTRHGDDNLSHPFYWSAFTVIGSPW